MCQYCCDADMLVVPPAFAIFVAKFRPRLVLQVRHMAMPANGTKVLTATTLLVPEPYVRPRSVAFRLHIMDASVASLIIPLLGFSESWLKVWWSSCEQKGICSVTPLTLRQANGYMDHFMEMWKDILGFITIHKGVGSHFTLKKPAVLQVHPGGEAPPWTDVEKAGFAKSLELVQEIEALKVGDLVPVCDVEGVGAHRLLGLLRKR